MLNTLFESGVGIAQVSYRYKIIYRVTSNKHLMYVFKTNIYWYNRARFSFWFLIVCMPVLLYTSYGYHPTWLSSSHTVYLVSPENNSFTNLNNNSLAFVYNHTGSLTGIVNCTLFVDGRAVNYKTNVSANTTITVYSNESWNEGEHLLI